MKKFLLLLSGISMLSVTQAQTITSADFGNIGDSYQLGTDATPGVGPGASGSGQTWNFTTFTTETLDTLHFIDPTTAPNGSDFPSSNIATESDQGIFFMEKTSAYVKNDGVVGTFAFITASVVFNPGLDIIQFPASLGTNFTTHSTADIITYVGIDTTILGCNIVLDSIWVKRTADFDVNFDASGEVVLPIGVFPNSLRSYTEQRSVDSIFIYAPNPIVCAFPPVNIPQGWSFADPTLVAFAGLGTNPALDTTRIYTWYATGEKFSVCAMDVDYAGNPTSVRFKSDYAQYTMSVNEPFTVETSLYPNPAGDNIRISATESLAGNMFMVFDVNGRKIFSQQITDDGNINTSSLNQGVYLYMVSDQQNKPVSKGRFVISR